MISFSLHSRKKASSNIVCQTKNFAGCIRPLTRSISLQFCLASARLLRDGAVAAAASPAAAAATTAASAAAAAATAAADAV